MGNGINGQMNIFDFISVSEEPPVLLYPRNEVFVVSKGDIEKFYVEERKSWICGSDNENRGYCLSNGRTYNVITNMDIGICAFLEHDRAKIKAEEYINSHDVILADDIRIVKTVAYGYRRKVDDRDMVAFYCTLDNGDLYMKEFMTFCHIVKNTKKAIEKFMSQQEFEFEDPVQINCIVNPKNMYKCKGTNDWLYTEAGCAYGIG